MQLDNEPIQNDIESERLIESETEIMQDGQIASAGAKYRD